MTGGTIRGRVDAGESARSAAVGDPRRRRGIRWPRMFVSLGQLAVPVGQAAPGTVQPTARDDAPRPSEVHGVLLRCEVRPRQRPAARRPWTAGISAAEAGGSCPLFDYRRLASRVRCPFGSNDSGTGVWGINFEVFHSRYLERYNPQYTCVKRGNLENRNDENAGIRS